MFELFKKDYRPEFEKRYLSKIEDKALMTRIRHGKERAKIEENIRKSVCACIAPHTNRDLKVVWETMSEVSSAVKDATTIVTKYENNVGEIIMPISQKYFNIRCNTKLEHTGNKEKEIKEVGASICKCISENVLPLVGKNVSVLTAAMYDAKYLLRDANTIKKFEKKMIPEACRFCV